MSFEERRVVQPGPLRWPRHPQLAGDAPESIALYTYLLDSDGELADEFDVRARIAARQLATARVLQVGVGACDLGPWFEASGQGLGLLILDGLLALEIRVGGRTAAELVGPGDLLQPLGPAPDQMIVRTSGWRALRPTRLAVLDSDFADRVRPFPQIVRILARRACRRPLELDVLRAITSQPRLEVRLVLLLWHLADRWGRVEPSGVRLSLPLTHRLLGQLVAAERPSISHALKRLAQAGLVTGATDDLHLHDSLEYELQVLSEREPVLAERPASHPRRVRRPIA
ncbi:MAG TPA: helix-turn-helix domain-containing protein [Solirubrobacteraceae bacterium]|nr:helix-turn-helix domain-containing protein [Solirubrobacteraceae bacterium]